MYSCHYQYSIGPSSYHESAKAYLEDTGGFGGREGEEPFDSQAQAQGLSERPTAGLWSMARITANGRREPFSSKARSATERRGGIPLFVSCARNYLHE
jgi:hypothetical protein